MDKKKGLPLLKEVGTVIQDNPAFLLLKCKRNVSIENVTTLLKDLAFVSIREGSV
jgi:hypothetical protein